MAVVEKKNEPNKEWIKPDRGMRTLCHSPVCIKAYQTVLSLVAIPSDVCLEPYIEKTKLLERSCCKRQRQFKNNSLHWSRGCGPRLQAIDMATPNVLFHANALRLSKTVSETRKREREEQGNQGTMTALVTVQITYRKSSIKPPGGLFCFKTINWSGGGGGVGG